MPSSTPSSKQLESGRATPTLEARRFTGNLSPVEWRIRGSHSRLFVILEGSGVLRVNETALGVQPPSIIWLPAGETAALSLEAGSQGASLVIPELVLGSAMPAGTAFADVREAISRPLPGLRISRQNARRFLVSIAEIEAEIRESEAASDEMIRHHLALILLLIRRIATPQQTASSPSPGAIVRGFVHLVDLHMRDHWTIPTYARSLSITPDRLNAAVRRATGRSPMEVIHSRLLTEATMLLTGSSMQVTEIADALGFKDTAYFSRFYKRMAGIAPREQRNGSMSRQTRVDTSYADWP